MSEDHNYFSETWPLHQQAESYLPRANPTFSNPEFENAAFRVLIVRLSPFRDVDRSTPHLFLYQAVRRAMPEAYIDLAFFPPVHDRARFERAGAPLLFGAQSFRAASGFHLVLISNAYTLELINLPYLLLHSGIPVMAGERGEAWPPFILGGSNALATQALIAPEGDAVPDGIFFGEGEVEVERLVRVLHECADESKRARLEQARAEVGALWLANGGAEQRVRKAIHPAPAEESLLLDYPRLNSPEAATARLQITYGCPAFCSFCFEGYDRKPYRELPYAVIMEGARRLKRQGVQTLELYSFNFNTHSAILDLLLELNRLFHRVGIKSQRVDFLYTTPGLIQAEVMADKRSFTLGIEGISEGMRAFLHKSLDIQAILGVLTALLREKIREIKLFYILTGHETEADIEELRAFLHELKRLRRRLNPGIRIVFSVGLLVRMPFTPLQHDALFLEDEAWRQIVGPMKSACETNGFEFRLATEWEEYAASQVLALGGKWLLEPVLALARAGHCYDTGLTPGYWPALRARLEAEGHWTTDFLGEKGPDYAFPLDFVDNGLSADFLYCRYEEARARSDGGYCLGRVGKPGLCLACGACGTPEQRQQILQHRMSAPARTDYWRELPQLMQRKWRLKPLYLLLRTPSITAGLDPAWLNAWALEHLLDFHPELTDNLLTAEESLFTRAESAGRYPGCYGETIFALRAWDPEAVRQQLLPREEAGLIRFVDDFEPGRFQQLRLNLILPAEHFPYAGQRLRAYLHANYVPANLRRLGAGYVFDLPAKALKKRTLFEGSYREEGDDFVFSLVVGPKFDLRAYLEEFAEPRRYREAKIRILELVL